MYYIPVELFEVAAVFWARLTVLSVNLAIVAYLGMRSRSADGHLEIPPFQRPASMEEKRRPAWMRWMNPAGPRCSLLPER